MILSLARRIGAKLKLYTPADDAVRPRAAFCDCGAIDLPRVTTTLLQKPVSSR